MKGQFLRFNDETKLYSVKVANVKTAIAVRESMKMVSAEDEKDLDATAPTGEDINEIFDFEEAHSNVINIIGSIDLNGTDTTLGSKVPRSISRTSSRKLTGPGTPTPSAGLRPWAPRRTTSRPSLKNTVEHYDGVAGHGDSDEDE